jgi:hypothetical protein
VDPRYKHMGIMNAMFDALIEKARELDYLAIYGEALMLHPYSQKANLRQGMTECAILIGEVPSQMTIERRLHEPQRSAALVSYLLFEKKPRYVSAPKVYARQIMEVYENAGVTRTQAPLPYEPRDPIEHRHEPHLNIGMLRFEALVDAKVFTDALDELFEEHCDMIYADINLHRIEAIDTLVALLNAHHFFYSGVLFAAYNGEDYLRLQRKNSKRVDEEQLVCYSRHARELLRFIRSDERKVQK